jgi:peptide/nickel transport system permease protein
VKQWWLQPLVRIGVACVLPFAVPLIITYLIWALPGDPASIICPPELCGGTDELAKRWNLDGGAFDFYAAWIVDASMGDFGNSWRVLQGMSIVGLLKTAVPNTVLLIVLSLIPLVVFSAASCAGWLPRRLDPLFQVIGLVPAVVYGLVAAAVIQLSFGADAFSEEALLVRLLVGALVLGVADGALAGAVTGTRSLFDAERKQRYVQVAVLRGEGVFSNTFPNLAAALAGQLRARTLHLLSGAVIIEAVLQIDGLGDYLWRGTLQQDFGLVLATATGFAVVSAGLLALQGVMEIVVALHVRRSPSTLGNQEAA